MHFIRTFQLEARIVTTAGKKETGRKKIAGSTSGAGSACALPGETARVERRRAKHSSLPSPPHVFGSFRKISRRLVFPPFFPPATDGVRLFGAVLCGAAAFPPEHAQCVPSP
ncbi:Hypothetical predicted protein [Podarcis lilfordi]|uniref:Uncharacterized protein n=1 Tax=Podarcis lilfordi TaxID=74358 RepID=A0AA35K3Y3_9SAUR|nr:Hypothetical predicted protein [Podarcis lilfordi]